MNLWGARRQATSSERRGSWEADETPSGLGFPPTSGDEKATLGLLLCIRGIASCVLRRETMDRVQMAEIV